MIPDFHILCCIIIIFLLAGVRIKILYMYNIMLKMAMSVLLVLLVEQLRLGPLWECY